jgi:hypothetical protein
MKYRDKYDVVLLAAWQSYCCVCWGLVTLFTAQYAAALSTTSSLLALSALQYFMKAELALLQLSTICVYNLSYCAAPLVQTHLLLILSDSNCIHTTCLQLFNTQPHGTMRM